MTHPQLTKLSNAQLEWEVRTPSKIIEDIIGKNPCVCATRLAYPIVMSAQLFAKTA